MANNAHPLFCCMLVHGAKNKPRESEAAFLRWKDQVLTSPVCWVASVDSYGFPLFYVTTLVHVQPPAGFMEKTFLEICAQVGVGPKEVPSLHERYLTYDLLFISEIGNEEPEPVG